MIVKYKMLEGGHAPEFKYQDDACADCFARIGNHEFIKVPNGSRCRINLGFSLQLMPFTEAVIRPKSGLSLKGIDIAIGTIDKGYTGEVSCILINNSGGEYVINDLDCVCQIAFRTVGIIEMQETDYIAPTDRGVNGFGSTGLKAWNV